MIDVTCAIVIKEGKILATQRSEKMALPLKWEFPGGKVDNHESVNECIARELKEELNIEIEILSKLTEHPYDYGEFKINLIPFVSKYMAGDIILTEHKDYKWLAKEDLWSLDWAPADIPVLEEFLILDL
jgi:8-oxo-dGTP diphosphatase